jgi:hypothetical protein
MRESDIEEIWASHHHVPIYSLTTSLEESLFCISIMKDNHTLGMFGIQPDGILGEFASIWLLGANELTAEFKKKIRLSRNFIKFFLQHYPLLHNFVDARNKISIKWLRFCGAEIEEAAPFGIEQKPFHYFSFRR